MNDEKTFRKLLNEATQLAQSIKQRCNSSEATAKELDKHFPGLMEMSNELSCDMSFIADAGANCDMLTSMDQSNSVEEAIPKLQAIVELNQSTKFGNLHRLSVRNGLRLGLEIGYILANLYKHKSGQDDEFEKFMQGLMDTKLEGPVQ